MNFLGHRRVLVVTAVEPERQAVLRGLSGAGVAAESAVMVEAGGVGSAAAAAATARVLALGRFDAVLSAGIGGGIGVPIGGTTVATASIAADLGADSPDGFIGLDELGFGTATLATDPELVAAVTAAVPHVATGPVLTVSTVTGTLAGTRDLTARYPDAVAEAMEGFGVATAAAQAGVPFVELRTISNPVGPRDRDAWRIGDALEGLSEAFTCLAKLTP
ncbi:futalosine hydrolase [Planosporangium flavigriseum]|uniref:Futalosine hydrolase n=1 Tax=Planosporangium flavigriseum TaxID=373681 RepID=A0A8J3PNW5_9ACTN|nr:futalosine hydrolase [Planosporangium flavigriseum]NJC66845.1 futalosine hydrolase [Planosporangium flavigriseum]GIG74411.1 Futalosine hydrolase [Planosporangium flavigriseum]